MSELALVARILPKPLHRQAAFDAILGILAQTRAEPGCLRFELNEGDDGDMALYLEERWVDDAALKSHYDQPYVAKVFAAYEEWLAEPVQIWPMRPAA
ncbi:Quinol monooxygenase YgiN [Jannaschia faecimaris]|uniref:Quinol monooxygenase YgiN n=1 Tax=Jannaschia faecimaris TaxID=1244108 RepID=A0A1H3QKJ2_9RHOB|nr:putative quinol monooxygenase [Jannaschia faecimaris]SDZ13621.1 Quinol monooxygenase YgiN [Jannaschia faecimaris]